MVVKLDGKGTKWSPLGSIPGPLLFTTYVNDLYQVQYSCSLMILN